MLNGLVKVKSHLSNEPSTKRSIWSKYVGNDVANALVENGYIVKEGSTKGAKWHWVKDAPTYDTQEEIETLMTKEKSQEVVHTHTYETFVDVLVKNKIQLNVGKGVEIVFGDVEMLIKKGKKCIKAKTPNDFHEILTFLM